jgi:AraC family transcriptional regulator
VAIADPNTKAVERDPVSPFPPVNEGMDAWPWCRFRHLASTGAMPDAGRRSALILVLRGEPTLTGPDYALRMESGSVLVSDGRTPATLRCELSGPAELLCAWPDLASPEVASASPLRGWLLPIVHEPQSEVATVMRRLAERLRASRTRRIDAPQLVNSWLEAIMSAQAIHHETIERCPGRTAERRRDLFVRLARARALLGSPACAMDVAQCARVASLSTSHFVRLFHRAFGESPHQFRSTSRMLRARALILSTDLSVRDVMRRTGFDTLASFSRAFRQHHGVSATALRSIGRREAADGFGAWLPQPVQPNGVGLAA